MKKKAKDCKVLVYIDRETKDDFVNAMRNDAIKRGDKYSNGNATDYRVTQSTIIRKLIKAYIKEHK